MLGVYGLIERGGGGPRHTHTPIFLQDMADSILMLLYFHFHKEFKQTTHKSSSLGERTEEEKNFCASRQYIDKYRSVFVFTKSPIFLVSILQGKGLED